MAPDAGAEAAQVAALEAWRQSRDGAKAEAALADLKAAAGEGRNVMEPSIACAHAGVTTGEWAAALRQVFGEYRAPTGVGGAASAPGGPEPLVELRAGVEAAAAGLGRRPKLLIGKPGLDGHSNGAEQIAVRARDAGFEVVYQGIRLTPEQIVRAALEEGVHLVGLSILSGSHLPLVAEVRQRLVAAGLGDVPLVVGGIVPPEDAEALKSQGVAAVFTPKDYDLNGIMTEILALVEEADQAAA